MWTGKYATVCLNHRGFACVQVLHDAVARMSLVLDVGRQRSAFTLFTLLPTKDSVSTPSSHVMLDQQHSINLHDNITVGADSDPAATAGQARAEKAHEKTSICTSRACKAVGPATTSHTSLLKTTQALQQVRHTQSMGGQPMQSPFTTGTIAHNNPRAYSTHDYRHAGGGDARNLQPIEPSEPPSATTLPISRRLVAHQHPPIILGAVGRDAHKAPRRRRVVGRRHLG